MPEDESAVDGTCTDPGVSPPVETKQDDNADPICVPLNNGTCVGVRLPPNTAVDEDKTDEAPEASSTFLRSLGAEYLGTLLLVWVVVGSGIMGQQLSNDVGVQLMINSFATIGGLYNIILVLGPVSGCHINPIVSMIDLVRRELSVVQFGAYVVVQCLGGITGALVANLTFDYSFALAEKDRFGHHLWISEVLSTALLILVIHGNLRSGQSDKIPGAVALLVGAGYFFTSSTIFANPAVTVGRMFSNSFAGIGPRSAGPFVVCQIFGALLGYGLVRVMFPHTKEEKDSCSQQHHLKQVAFVDMQNAIVSKNCNTQCA